MAWLERSEHGQARTSLGKRIIFKLLTPFNNALGVAENPGQVVDAADPLSADTKEPLGKAIESGTRNSTSLLPPVSIESSEFLNTVWVHMDAHKRGRLSLKDFEEQLSMEPPETADKVIREYILRLRSVGSTSGTESEQAKRLFQALDTNRTGVVSFAEMWSSSLQLGVVRSNFVASPSGRRFLFAETSLGCMKMSWRIRQLAAGLITDHRFEAFILGSIVVNSVVMALEDNEDPGQLVGNPSFRNQLVVFGDALFLGIFAFETSTKIVAMGLVANERCYLREGWNRLDAVVVVSGIIGYFPGVNGTSLGVLRIFRILRPLRTLRASPTLRQIVEALLGSIPGVINVLILQTMFFLLFAVLGLQLWAGVTHYQCRATALPTANGTWDTYADDPRVCSPGGGGLFRCETDFATMSTYPFCASPAEVPAGSAWEDPHWRPQELHWGITSFDNIGTSLLTVFQCVTMEGWVTAMYMYRDGFNPWFSPIFFVAVVGFGGFFMVNLFFAVMWEQFSSIADIQGPSRPDDPDTHQRFGERARPVESKRGTKVTPTENVSSLLALEESHQFDTSKPRRMARSLIESDAFQVAIIICIVFNTFLLCLDSYPEDPDLVYVTELANFCLTMTFAAEMALKVWALGPRCYVADRFNFFDGVIVLFSLLELLLTSLGSVQGLGGMVSSLRFFRLLRVFKLAKSWKSMRRIITTAGDSLYEMVHIIALLALFIYASALLGMKLFSTKFWFAEGGVSVPFGEVIQLNATERVLAGISQPRVNFESFISSVIACFILITGEDWHQVMYDGIRGGGSYWYSIFFVGCVGLGQFVVLNLFLAVLLGNIDTIGNQETKTRGAELPPPDRENWSRLRSAHKMLPVRLVKLSRPRRRLDASHGGMDQDASSEERKRSAEELRDATPATANSATGKWSGNAGEMCDGREGGGIAEQDPTKRPRLRALKRHSMAGRPSINPFVGWRASGHSEPGESRDEGASSVETDGGAGEEHDDEHGNLWRRFCCGKPRQVCRDLIAHHNFEVCTMALIFASSVTLVIQTPLDDPSMAKTKVLRVVDSAMTGVFAGEMVLKIFAMGTSYFRDEWNLMDGAIVIISVTSDVFGALAGKGDSFSSLRALRALRALRPLRLIPRAPGLRRVVNAMIRGLPSVLNVAVVVLVVFLVLSILGVYLFKGTFIGCNISGLETAALATLTSKFGLSRATYVQPLRQDDCLAAGGTWGETIDQNFNNVASGLLSLFEISTTEGWVGVMLAGVDSVGIDINPVEGWNPWNTLFFIGAIVVGNFFATNLFVGAVIEAYQTLSSEDAAFLMSDAQKSWVELQKMAGLARLKAQPKRPPGKWRGWAFDTVEKPWFEKAVICIIVSYTFILILHHWGEPPAVTQLIEISSTAFTFIFVAELILKAMAYGIVKLLKGSPWDLYDALVVVVAIIAMVLNLLYDISFQALASTARITRVLLVFKVMRGAQSLQELMDMLVANLLGMFNISALLVLLMCCYSVVGVHLFATVALQTEISVHSNFQTFSQALLTLFRYTTGEAWNTAMHELFISPSDGNGIAMPIGTSCVEDLTYAKMSEAWDTMGTTTHMIGCGPNPAVTVTFFLSYIMLSTFMLINIFVAIIVDSVSTHYETRALKLSDFQLCVVCDEWSRFDPDATYLLNVEDLPTLWQTVQIPLGLPAWVKPRRISETRTWVASLGINNYGGKVYFHEVVNALTLKAVENRLAQAIRADQRQEERRRRTRTGLGLHKSTQAQASAIIKTDVLQSPDMEKHSMFRNKTVSVKQAKLNSIRSVHSLEEVMAAAHVQYSWRQYCKRARTRKSDEEACHPTQYELGAPHYDSEGLV